MEVDYLCSPCPHELSDLGYSLDGPDRLQPRLCLLLGTRARQGRPVSHLVTRVGEQLDVVAEYSVLARRRPGEVARMKDSDSHQTQPTRPSQSAIRNDLPLYNGLLHTAMSEKSRHPSVGVIIPNHSRVESLLETLQSIAAQDYVGQINVYLVYLQRPGIADIVSQLAPEITAIPTLATGLGTKRNLGLDVSTEDLIAFVDDDDLWHPAKVTRQVEALAGSGAVACCTRYVSFSHTPFQWPERVVVPAVRPLSAREIAFSSTIAVSSMISEGSLIRSLRFTERAEWSGVEDFHLWLQMQEHTRIACLEDRLTAMRIDHSSLSARGRVTQELRALNVLGEWHRAGKRDWSSIAGLVRRTVDSAIARPGDDAEEDLRLLLMTYDGNLIGRHADRAVVTLVRASWRSRVIAPLLRWLRRQEYRLRLALMPRPPMEFTDEHAREGQWGRDAR
jgi:teichuronic acid biosynthesis glycosyltransferase TuaG